MRIPISTLLIFSFFSINICFAQPSNDLCGNAVTLPVGLNATCVGTSASNVAATDSGEMPAPSCGGFVGGDIWYSVTVPASGNISVETNNDGSGTLTDSAISLYSGTCGALTEIECDDDDSADGLFSLVELTGQTPGDVIFIRVWEFFNDNPGTFEICAFEPAPPPPPPGNDLCANAISLAVGVGTTCSNTVGTNEGATDSGEQPLPSCANYDGGDIWYSVTVPSSGIITVESSTAGGFTDSGMSIFSGTCGSLTELDCDDDDGDGLFSMISLTGQTPGDVLFVRVWEWGNNSFGEFNICAYGAARDCDANVGDFGKYRDAKKIGQD